jgi:hypothetical protein
MKHRRTECTDAVTYNTSKYIRKCVITVHYNKTTDESEVLPLLQNKNIWIKIRGLGKW